MGRRPRPPARRPVSRPCRPSLHPRLLPHETARARMPAEDALQPDERPGRCCRLPTRPARSTPGAAPLGPSRTLRRTPPTPPRQASPPPPTFPTGAEWGKVGRDEPGQLHPGRVLRHDEPAPRSQQPPAAWAHRFPAQCAPYFSSARLECLPLPEVARSKNYFRRDGGKSKVAAGAGPPKTTPKRLILPKVAIIPPRVDFCD